MIVKENKLLIMEFKCREEIVSTGRIEFKHAKEDATMSSDHRIINNLVASEKLTIPHLDYFRFKQKDIQPFMRKMVTTWMLEVCDFQYQ